MASRKVQVGPEARAGWKEEWSWKDKKGVWRKRTIFGTGTAKLSVDSAPPRPRKRRRYYR